jgi:peptidoglycan/xylan/chitin deacetylase (PgdA/CDA1 family)
MYHSFDRAKLGTYAAVSPETFLKQMEFIKRNKYEVISLQEYCQALKEGRTQSRNSVIITIDDGYKDNLIALKVLSRFDYPVTLFLATDTISNQGYLSYEDISYFLKNTQTTIGSHTLTHSYLPDLSEKDAKQEIFNSKRILELRFLDPIKAIAYPVGGFSEKIVEDVEKAGYLCACATNRGFSKKLDRFSLRRIKITNRDLGFRFWAKLSGFYNIFKKVKKPY